MKCSDCIYCYQDENDEYERCHYEGYWMAPCEEDDEYYDDEAENDMFYYEVEVE